MRPYQYLIQQEAKNGDRFFAVKNLLLYRGSNKRFSVQQSLEHEILHPAKERSAMAYVLHDINYDFNQNDSIEIVKFTGVSLLYSETNIKRVYNGDVWTVRSKYNPLYVRKTSCGGWCRCYDECIVTGTPFAIVSDNDNRKVAKFIAKNMA